MCTKEQTFERKIYHHTSGQLPRVSQKDMEKEQVCAHRAGIVFGQWTDNHDPSVKYDPLNLVQPRQGEREFYLDVLCLFRSLFFFSLSFEAGCT